MSFSRNNFTCQYCGKSTPEVELARPIIQTPKETFPLEEQSQVVGKYCEQCGEEADEDLIFCPNC